MFAEDDCDGQATVKHRGKVPGGARDVRVGFTPPVKSSTSPLATSSTGSHSPSPRQSHVAHSRSYSGGLSQHSPSPSSAHRSHRISHSKSSPGTSLSHKSSSPAHAGLGVDLDVSPMMTTSFDSSYGTDESNSAATCLEMSKMLKSGDDGLFNQLLDDLDNISTLESAQQRRRATQIFSSWLFSPSAQRTSSSVLRPNRGSLRRIQDENPTRRYTADLSDFDVKTYEEEEGPMWGEHTGMATVFRRGTKARHSVGVGAERIKRNETIRRSSLDVVRSKHNSESTSPENSEKEDPDSGYHTGNSKVLTAACRKSATIVRPASASAAVRSSTAAVNKEASGNTSTIRRVKIEKKVEGKLDINLLQRRISAFNKDSPNSHGLLIDEPSADGQYKGAIRIHRNLIRPINMCTTTRPPDRCHTDTLSNETFSQEHMEVTAFYIPKHTTVVHINSDTKTTEVICTLLSKFRITDNPRKFALYEKRQKYDKTDSLRRMGENETPLTILLDWADHGLEYLDQKKFVLQENDTGEIHWDEFSLPELDNFLTVLNREEEEYIDQVKNKYRARRLHIAQLLQERRPPIFV